MSGPPSPSASTTTIVEASRNIPAITQQDSDEYQTFLKTKESLAQQKKKQPAKEAGKAETITIQLPEDKPWKADPIFQRNGSICIERQGILCARQPVQCPTDGFPKIQSNGGSYQLWSKSTSCYFIMIISYTNSVWQLAKFTTTCDQDLLTHVSIYTQHNLFTLGNSTHSFLQLITARTKLLYKPCQPMLVRAAVKCHINHASST